MASTLSRAELQALAKQHGIKANLKNAEIEAALKEKGVAPAKKVGLSVRDENVVEEIKTEPKAKRANKGKSVKETDENASVVSGPVAKRTSKAVPSTASLEENTQPSDTQASQSELPPKPKRTSRTKSAVPEDNIAPQDEQITKRRSERVSGSPSAAMNVPQTPVSANMSGTGEQLLASITATPGSAVATLTEVEKSPADENAAMENIEVSKPRRSTSQRYVSKRRTVQREQILSEMAQLDVSTTTTTVVMENDKLEKEAPMTVKSTPLAPLVSTPLVEQTAPVVSSKRSGRQIRVPKAFRDEDSAAISADMAASAETSVQPAQEEVAKVSDAVVNEAETLKMETEPEKSEPVATLPQSEAVETNTASAEVQPRTEASIVAPLIPLPAPTLKRLAPIPLLLPPTPAKIREKIQKELDDDRSDVEKLKKQYETAIEALSFVPGLLQRQRELISKLEECREENKRLKDYIESDA